MDKKKKYRKIIYNSCCFVPGCKSGYQSTRKLNKSLGKKNPTLFSVKDPGELEKWNKAVQRYDKDIKVGDKICELHFKEDDIVRYYETLLPDGTVWRIERARVGLKNGAVPTIFNNLRNVGPRATNSQSTNQTNSQNVEPCTSNSSSTNQPNSQNVGLYVTNSQLTNQINLQNVGACATDPPSTNQSNSQNVELYVTNSQLTNQSNSQNSPRKRKSSKTFNAIMCTKRVKPYAKILPKSTETKLNEYPKHSVMIANYDAPEIAETIANENFKQTRVVLNEMTETFTYSTLVKNLELVTKPGLLWGLAILDEFLMCAKWDEDGTLMKRVIIDCNLKIQVFLKNRAIDFDSVNIKNVKHLSFILHEVDKYGICINANNMEKTGCDGYVLLRAHGNQCRYCQLIGDDYEIDRKTNFYWLSKGKSFTKHQILYDRIQTLKNNNALLKAQINKIMKIKAVWKLSNQTNQNPMTS